MGHSKAMKDRVLAIYLQTRTIEGTARQCGISGNTLRRWREKYKWDDHLEDMKKEVAEDPFGECSALEKYIKEVEVTQEDADVLRQIKTIEGICFACIRDDIPDSKIHLKPKNFKEAADVLKSCWQARDTLLHRKENPTFNISGQTKIDFISQE